MRSVLIAAALVLASFGASAQTPAPGSAEALVRDFFNGQQMLVTYREGGALYGTVFALQVHFCRSGRYMTFGESHKQTVLGNDQVNRFADEGMWEIATFRGQVILKYTSASNPPNIVAVNVAPDGR